MDEDNDLIFGLFEENDDSSVSSYNSTIVNDDIGRMMDEEEEDESHRCTDIERKAFWEAKEQLLQATLYRTSRFETTIRQVTKDVLRDLDSVVVNCGCPKMVGNCCRSCTQREIANFLRNSGFNCVECKSKWRSTPQISAGTHSYLQVMQNSGSMKGKIEVIIELNFRAQFVVARACEEYNLLLQKLPEIYVGKVERLRNVIKIMCSASKKCMEERKMHIAPWRKEKYMQAKWRGTPLHQAAPPVVVIVPAVQRPKPMASMLSLNLSDNLSGFHSMSIRVI